MSEQRRTTAAPSVEHIVGAAVLQSGNGHAQRLEAAYLVIRQAGLITSRNVANEIGVSQRSVFRYIDDLQRAGAPIVGEGREGFRWYGRARAALPDAAPLLTFCAPEEWGEILGELERAAPRGESPDLDAMQCAVLRDLILEFRRGGLPWPDLNRTGDVLAASTEPSKENR
ncbi:HTH domain-containing protein [Ramlibacter sp.]|uniref:HTH domain-containing protein n=1 Tax=Ramlibacter sp. TaxID=1917967 RepID=UPI003D0C236C